MHLYWGEVMVGYTETGAVYQPEREVSPDTNHAGALVLDFQTQEFWEVKFCRLSHFVCGILL